MKRSSSCSNVGVQHHVEARTIHVCAGHRDFASIDEDVVMHAGAQRPQRFGQQAVCGPSGHHVAAEASGVRPKYLRVALIVLGEVVHLLDQLDAQQLSFEKLQKLDNHDEITRCADADQ
jgi:hypothetical protein